MKYFPLSLSIIFLFLSACGSEQSKKMENARAAQLSGPDLFAKYACATCHSIDGSEMYGPTLQGLYMKELTVMRDGRIVTLNADDKYLKTAINDPAYEKVKGFESREMPIPNMPKEDLKLLVEYLKSLPDSE